MITLTIIPVHEWTEDMHSLDNQIRDAYNDGVIMDIALAYAEISNDIMFSWEHNGGDFGNDLNYARFYKVS